MKQPVEAIIPHIKICGLRDTATVQAMDGLAISEVGLVFAPSKRQVTIAEGKELVTAIHELRNENGDSPRAAGVFVNYPIAEMLALLKQVELDIVQLHGSESLSYYEQLHSSYPQLAIWKVLAIKEESLLSLMDMELQYKELLQYRPFTEALLIDAPGGGTGKTFNWEAIEVYKQLADKLGILLYVAGGLNENNVSALLEQYMPDGIDVSSGVETDGIKDIKKITSFVRKVRER